VLTTSNVLFNKELIYNKRERERERERDRQTDREKSEQQQQQQQQHNNNNKNNNNRTSRVIPADSAMHNAFLRSVRYHTPTEGFVEPRHVGVRRLLCELALCRRCCLETVERSIVVLLLLRERERERERERKGHGYCANRRSLSNESSTKPNALM
jgi:hypothetical protein